jgi:predicted Zn-dependent protease
MSFSLKSKVKIMLLASFVMIFGAAIPTQAVDPDYHPYSSCYDTYWNYGGWGYNNYGDVNINYTYTQNGDYYYGYRFLLGEQEWEEHFSFFNINEVSSNPNLTVFSDNYGDVSWVGKAYYTRSPKDILLNEWWHKTYSHYDYHEYTRVSIHELGHTHGLAHTSCKNEVMSNHKEKNIEQDWLGDGDVSGIRDIY